jgi:hypothetical protein
MDRQLEEALTHGPDALHLAAVSCISERAAIRYANAAKASGPDHAARRDTAVSRADLAVR